MVIYEECRVGKKINLVTISVPTLVVHAVPRVKYSKSVKRSTLLKTFKVQPTNQSDEISLHLFARMPNQRTFQAQPNAFFSNMTECVGTYITTCMYRNQFCSPHRTAVIARARASAAHQPAMSFRSSHSLSRSVLSGLRAPSSRCKQATI
jgi:hypothetical protein